MFIEHLSSCDVADIPIANKIEANITGKIGKQASFRTRLSLSNLQESSIAE
jgi:hypothetical protein